MESEKKPKRPRIGAIIPPAQNDEQRKEGGENRYEKVNYPGDGTGYKPSYQPRPRYNPNQGYQNRNYQNRDSYQRPQYDNNQGGYQRYNNQNAEGQAAEGEQQPQQNPGYNNQNRQGGYNNHRPGGYNQNRQGGYNNRQGGYNNNRQGGYNNYNNRQGGYNNRQGGYNNNRQGGYNNRQGGYNNAQGGYSDQQHDGGYNNYDNRQGGYNNNRQGGYNNNRQGGYNNNNRQGGYNNNRPGASFNRQGGQRFTPRPKQIVYDVPEVDPNEEVRLNKFMANAGICSRREADELIQQGLVKVNGNVVTELGSKIKRDDVVEYNDKVVTLENKCYILLNKPKDCVTTSDDPDGRLTVMDIVKNACKERIYPVGRLDRNTTGVLLLTNDGDLASKLTHPKYVKKKIYQVWTDKNIAEDDMQQLADGIELEDGPIHADAISYVNDHDKNQAGIEIHSGRNRIVRRMFESLGYRVTKLDRVYFAGLTKKNLPRGRWRYLTQEEVNFLKQGSFE